ncbi:hypothetical protein BC830DRAFT_1127819 [Chytriomyces sp. MP71]|nr:hypothetical protein BC830DRAFT_1127819 [Chytriomyces sp. MP71]
MEANPQPPAAPSPSPSNPPEQVTGTGRTPAGGDPLPSPSNTSAPFASAPSFLATTSAADDPESLCDIVLRMNAIENVETQKALRGISSLLVLASNANLAQFGSDAEFARFVADNTLCSEKVAKSVATAFREEKVLVAAESPETGTPILHLDCGKLTALLQRHHRFFVQDSSADWLTRNMYWDLLVGHMNKHAPNDPIQVSYTFQPISNALSATISINGMDFTSTPLTAVQPSGNSYHSSTPKKQPVSAVESRNDAARLALLFLQKYHAGARALTSLDATVETTHGLASKSRLKSDSDMNASSFVYIPALEQLCLKRGWKAPVYTVEALDLGLGFRGSVTVLGSPLTTAVVGSHKSGKSAARDSAAEVALTRLGIDTTRLAPRTIPDTTLLNTFSQRNQCRVSYDYTCVGTGFTCTVCVDRFGAWTSIWRDSRTEAKQRAAALAVIGIGLREAADGENAAAAKADMGIVEVPEAPATQKHGFEGGRKDADTLKTTRTDTILPQNRKRKATNASAMPPPPSKHALPPKPPSLPPKPSFKMAATPQISHHASSSVRAVPAPFPVYHLNTMSLPVEPLPLPSQPQIPAGLPMASTDPAVLLATIQQQQALLLQQQHWLAQQMEWAKKGSQLKKE